jgi:hypothetical protein
MHGEHLSLGFKFHHTLTYYIELHSYPLRTPNIHYYGQNYMYKWLPMDLSKNLRKLNEL